VLPLAGFEGNALRGRKREYKGNEGREGKGGKEEKRGQKTPTVSLIFSQLTPVD